jgi:uncharacterized membrane protein YciS (DUF1049 family)
MVPIKLLLILALIVMVTVFAVQNAGPISINLLGLFVLDVPLAAVIAYMLAVGVILGVLCSALWLLRHKRRIRELELKLKSRDEEIAMFDQMSKNFENGSVVEEER